MTQTMTCWPILNFENFPQMNIGSTSAEIQDTHAVATWFDATFDFAFDMYCRRLFLTAAERYLNMDFASWRFVHSSAQFPPIFDLTLICPGEIDPEHQSLLPYFSIVPS